MNKNKTITQKVEHLTGATFKGRYLAIALSSILLPACVADPKPTPDTSSSEAQANSSVAVTPSSSSIAMVASSAVAAVSSAASTDPVDCSVVDIAAGRSAFGGESCSACHDDFNEATGTAPGKPTVGAPIDVNSFKKFSESNTSLDTYIASKMMNFTNGCADGDAACEATAANIATFLKSTSNNPWCSDAGNSSVAVSSSAPASASSSSEPMAQGGPGTENTLLTSTGEFDSGAEGFTTYLGANVATFSWNNTLNVSISATTNNGYDVQVKHPVAVQAGMSYTVCFDAFAVNNRDIELNIDSDEGFRSVVSGPVNISIGTNIERFKHTFTASTTDDTSRLLFNVGVSDADVTLDNIGLYHGTQCNEVSMLPPPPEPGEADPSAGCGQAPGQTGNTPIGNGNSYLVALPQNYDRNKAYPLYFDFHNTSSDGPRYSARGDGFSRNAKNNAIFVYPTARNIGGGWGSADFQMFEPLYNRITDQFCVNKAAVFATGYSSGGDYSGMIACEHGDKVTGIAPVNPKPVGGYQVTNPDGRNCKGHVKAIIIYGNNDTVLNAYMGASGRDMAEFYRVKSGCSTNTADMPGYPQCKTYQGCMAGAEVSYCPHNWGYGGDGASNGAGHGYPNWTTGMFWDATAEFR